MKAYYIDIRYVYRWLNSQNVAPYQQYNCLGYGCVTQAELTIQDNGQKNLSVPYNSDNDVTFCEFDVTKLDIPTHWLSE